MYSMEFGCYLPPCHNPTIDPYTALKQDIELCGLADDLGFDEVWLGEHHSSGWHTLSAPDLLIAALARETRRIRFATGVIPLPYHHPVHTAERILLLDHLTAGRAILGCGTGTLIHDMEMIGVNPESLRAHFRAALEVVQALIGGQTVDVTTPWFTAKRAVLQIRPLKHPIETVVTSSLSDDAIELLTETATTPSVLLVPFWGTIRPGVDTDPVLSLTERVATYRNKSEGSPRVRCNLVVHIAESADKGIDELLPGFATQRRDLFRKTLGLPIPDSPIAHRKTLEALVDSGAFIVGDTATCTRKIRDLADRLGDPISLVFILPGWLSHSGTRDQLAGLASDVIPALRGGSDGTAESMKIMSAEAGRQIKRRAALG